MVVREGISSDRRRCSRAKEGGRRLSSEEEEEQESIVVIVASEEGPSGGRVWEEEASRRGVDVVEFWVEDGRTRFARRKVKNAEIGLAVCVLKYEYREAGNKMRTSSEMRPTKDGLL